MRSISVLVTALVWCAGIGTTASAGGDPQACRPAELFAADNTDDEQPLFELRAGVTIAQNGAVTTGSTPVEGVFWSNERQQTTFEHAREFHLCSADGPTLHTVAEALLRQFNQESVLTFDYLPRDAPPNAQANAIAIDVPDVDINRFRDAFVADSAAHNRLLGGSVTTTEHTLILIAGKDDLDIARRLIGEAGGDWNTATIAYGNRELVN